VRGVLATRDRPADARRWSRGPGEDPIAHQTTLRSSPGGGPVGVGQAARQSCSDSVLDGRLAKGMLDPFCGGDELPVLLVDGVVGGGTGRLLAVY
jgi:hypothetical protein